MNSKPKLVILSSDRRVKKFLVDTINQVIGSVAEIKGYSLDEGITEPVQAPVVLTSGKFLVPEAARIFPNSAIIPGRRVITGYNLEKLIMLPKAKKVLVVNHPKSATEETIEGLMNLGITHLIYIPWWKGRSVDLKPRVNQGDSPLGFGCFRSTTKGTVPLVSVSLQRYFDDP